MKYTQLFLFLMGFTFSVLSQIKVKTTETGLNLRTEPTTSSEVLYSIPNEAELLYANDWSEGWIKVRFTNEFEFDRSELSEVVDITGWVNIAFIETSLFKSNILEPISWEENTDGCFWGIYGVNGLLGIESFNPESTESKFAVKIKGVQYTLSVTDYNNNYYKWEHPQLKIEFFGATTDRGIESSESKGMLRIEYNGKVEYIYAALGGGC